ncbi:MAG: helix-turn-helix domain-containing protein [Eubacterium sp.]
MYKTRAEDGNNNIVGKKISHYRLKLKNYTSQRMLAEKMQINGVDIDKNAIQRIECGKRFVTDIELKVFASVLGVTYQDLLDS